MSHELTGNDYVSITRIGNDATIDGINVLHAAAAGLVEWLGGDGALLRASLALDGVAVDLSSLQWRRLDRWIPTFSVTAGDVVFTGTICAPAGYPSARGFFLRIEADNRGRTARELNFTIDVNWQWTQRCIATTRPLDGRNQLVRAGDDVLVLESDSGRGPALALMGDRDVTLTPGDSVSADNGQPLRAQLAQKVSVPAGRRSSVNVFIGAGRERDAAVMAARGLRRTGAEQWLRQTRLELSHILRAAQDHRWAELLNRNLLFNRFFAVGRSIDDDRLYLLRSRVTTSPAAALFSEREALLGTIPALILADPGVAREALFRALDVFSERSGELLRCIDGAPYDSGFNLDQLLLYVWCIFHYVDATGDSMVLDEPLVRQIVHETDISAFTRLHPQHMLAATELLPSGDVADYPYTTTGNALLCVFANLCARMPANHNGGDEKPRFAEAAREIEAAIWQHCVTDVSGNPVLVSSTNTEGDAAVYDDPALSLVLLPFFGFCPADDPVWRGAIEYLRSRRYPLWREGAVGGLARRSDPQHAAFSALCADLLGHAPEDALDRLLRVRLPSGVAAASYDPATGDAIDPYHAALAGFLAWALVRAAEPLETPRKSARKRR